MSGPTVTGRREARDGWDCLVLERTFRAPMDAVWAAVTEPERMVRWIGTWAGDPSSGSVQFRMTAEGDDVEAEEFRILACEPPRRLLVESRTPFDTEEPVDWRIELLLSEADGVTTLQFVQGLPEARMAKDVGPGWEYYLDRLVVAEGGGDVSTVDWDAYYPAQCDAYVAMFG